MNMPDEVRNRVSAIQHEIWADWMTYLFSQCEETPSGWLISLDAAAHWQRLAGMSYSELSTWAQDEEREHADRVLSVLDAQPAALEPDWSHSPTGADYHVFSWQGDGIWVGKFTFAGEGVKKPCGWEHGILGGKHSAYSGLRLPPGVDWRMTLRRRPDA